jgi:hypothetical protein
MSPAKGPALEELVRAYFARQGFFVLRSVPFKFEDDDVTDLDAWLYARQSATARVRAIVDVKNKKSPKAFERVLWVKGLQTAMKCDRAIIATTDNSASLNRFAQSQNIAVLSKDFLEKLAKKLDIDERLTLEQLFELIQSNPGQKQDGDWIRVLGEAKSAVASLPGFPAFNRAMAAFKFFGERVEVRMQHREAALRCALLTAAIACIALEIGLERFAFSDIEQRRLGLQNGVLFGDSGDGRSQASIHVALEAISESMQNGRAIAAQAKQQLETRLQGVRSEVISEYFMREHNSQHLFAAARELEAAAHTIGDPKSYVMSIETRSLLGIFADFVGVKRTSFPVTGPSGATSAEAPVAGKGAAAERLVAIPVGLEVAVAQDGEASNESGNSERTPEVRGEGARVPAEGDADGRPGQQPLL